MSRGNYGQAWWGSPSLSIRIRKAERRCGWRRRMKSWMSRGATRCCWGPPRAKGCHWSCSSPQNRGGWGYKFRGNAGGTTDATARVFNQAFVGPVFSGLSFKVRTGAPVPGDALSIDQSQNVSMTGNASALAYKFAGNAAAPTDATATIFNQANVGPTFSGLSFSVRTGATPANALTVDQHHNLPISNGRALIFPDGSVMGSAATGVGGGTITAVTAGAGPSAPRPSRNAP